jgi:magnesium-transporting ATPase (P-type)
MSAFLGYLDAFLFAALLTFFSPLLLHFSFCTLENLFFFRFLEQNCFLLCSPFVTEKLAECTRAGIRIIMVTDDDIEVSKSIARRLKLLSPTDSDTIAEIGSDDDGPAPAHHRMPSSAILHGESLRHITDDQLDDFLLQHDHILFGRTQISQKNRLIQAYQRLGQVVGIIGALAAESPAMRRADLGICRSLVYASKIAVHAADFVLEKDTVADLVTGIAECRRFGDSLQRNFAFLLTNKAAQIFPSLLLILLLMPDFIAPTLLLFLDAVVSVIFAFGFAFEPTNPALMLRPPVYRPKRSSIINYRVICNAYLQVGIFQAFSCLLTYFFVLGNNNLNIFDWNLLQHLLDPSYVVVSATGVILDFNTRLAIVGQAHSAILLCMTFLQIVNMLSLRSQTDSLLAIFSRQPFPEGWNLSLPPIFVVNLLVCAALIYVPPFNAFFWTSPVGVGPWLSALVFAGLLLLLQECVKLWLRRYPLGRFAQHLIF